MEPSIWLYIFLIGGGLLFSVALIYEIYQTAKTYRRLNRKHKNFIDSDNHFR